MTLLAWSTSHYRTVGGSACLPNERTFQRPPGHCQEIEQCYSSVRDSSSQDIPRQAWTGRPALRVIILIIVR